MTANLIRITREGTRTRIVVDGVEIPAGAIGRDSVRLPVDPDQVPSVTLTLLATTVDVLNASKGKTPHGTSDPS
ncbi:hypothetical protein ABZ714_19465 [Streptomyces sp. NPDC006798]|uniref:hypothetical protein n=1 Tax=Streptomyces sp. NPDC006798 TaxID=3155462 RepID=UPI0033D98733